MCKMPRKEYNFWRVEIQTWTFYVYAQNSSGETLREVVVLNEAEESLAFRKYCCKHNQRVWINSGIMLLKVKFFPIILTRKQEAKEGKWFTKLHPHFLQSCVIKLLALCWHCLQTEGPIDRKYGTCCVWWSSSLSQSSFGFLCPVETGLPPC